MEQTQKWLCECNSRLCSLSVNIPSDLAVRLLGVGNWYVIVDNCETGPNLADQLIEEEQH